MLRYWPADLDLGQAVELLVAYGATEPDAKAFLLEWLATGRLKARHAQPPDGARAEGLELAQIDWPASMVTIVVRYPASRDWPPTAWSRAVRQWQAKITMSVILFWRWPPRRA